MACTATSNLFSDMGTALPSGSARIIWASMLVFSGAIAAADWRGSTLIGVRPALWLAFGGSWAAG
ncbi:hypothetical protein [Streptomyces griseofuscus]|uniref:hypothetical protein n=1 Tax=Streptomyces griseofuscus TaxID=146922 RepID=UPI000F65372A|nr:hypothetical protein [Streptomyces griseofuscus]